MARLLTCGFELNSLTTGMEAFGLISDSVVTPTISSATKRTGTYALKTLLTTLDAQLVRWDAPGSETEPIFARAYLYIATLPNAASSIIATNAYVNLNADGTLDVLAQTGGILASAVGTLGTNTWNMLEISAQTSTLAVVVRLNGVQVFSGTSNVGSTYTGLQIGGNLFSGATAGEWYFDDVALNDSSGTVQNSYPGAGSVCYLRPNADGDAATGAPTRGGADSGANWSQLSEITPNDATAYMVLPVNPSDVWVNVDNGSVGGILAGATITLVEVHGRVSAASATASNWLPQIKKAVAGTISAATAVAWASAAWFTNDDTAAAQACKLVRYVDPDSAAWTPTTVDSMQISGKTTDGNPDTWLSTLWAIVEFVNPAGAQVPYQPQYLRAPVMAQ